MILELRLSIQEIFLDNWRTLANDLSWKLNRMFSWQFLSKLRSLFYIFVTILIITWGHGAIAVPTQVQPSSTPEFQTQFFAFLNQKYTLTLGEDRAACAYQIDPTDVYQQGNSRFVTAKVSRGSSGTACRGVLAFEMFQADCQAKLLYKMEREMGSDGRIRGWSRSEISLSDPTQRPIQSITSSQLAARVCALTVKPAA
jgi:hypothetical protein